MEIKTQINQLIEENTEGHNKYLVMSSVSDFKKLQRLMRDEYKIKPYTKASLNSMWRHMGTQENPTRVGTVGFDNFELNVIVPTHYKDDFVIKQVEDVDKAMFKNSK